MTSRSRSGLIWGLMCGVLGTAVAGPAAIVAPQRGSGSGKEGAAQSGRTLKFETYQDAKKEHRWRLKATNGQIIATGGQGYKDRRDCDNAIERIKKDAATKLAFETYEDNEGKYRWRLKATNGQVIATSQGYKDKRDCENSIDVIKKGAEKARVEEASE